MFDVKKLFDFWFPNYTCQACGDEIFNSPNKYLCNKCLENLPMMPEMPRTHYSPFIYAEPIRKMILSLKYDDNGYIARAVAPYLAAIYEKFLKKTNRKYILVPVPLHKSRYRERGYNQSTLIAKELAEYLHLPVIDDVLVRTRKTIIQKDMDAKARAQNMQGAFEVLKHTDCLRNQHVILLDDVYTTGATTQACSTTLKQYGVKSVTVLTLATAVPERDYHQESDK